MTITEKQIGRTVRLGPGMDLCLECAQPFSADGVLPCGCGDPATFAKAAVDDGVILGLWLPEPLARVIALPPGIDGGLPWETLHVTLVHLGRTTTIDPAALSRVLTVVPQFVERWTPMLAEVGGMAQFPPDDDNRVTVYAPVDGPDLTPFWSELTSLLNAAGVPYNRAHGFTPHVTLGTFPNGMIPSIEPLPSLPVDFTGLTLAVGDRRIEWPFMGAVDPTAVLMKNDLGVTADDIDPLRRLADTGDADATEALLYVGLSNVGKRTFTDDDRAAMASAGHALPNGSWPVVTRSDLSLALDHFDRKMLDMDADGAVTGHLLRRARDLDAMRMLPEWLAAVDSPPDLPDNLAFGVAKRAKPERFTFGPLYVPESIDAHGDYAVADDLQRSVWNYVRSGDRRIRLQHDVTKVVGEWVELAVWPMEAEVTMVVPGTAEKAAEERTVRFPAGTPWMGVVWSEDIWPAVERGEIRGYSLGGRAQRLAVDIPE